MALQAPWVDSSRDRDLLGRTPRHDAHDVLSEVVQGMAHGAGGGSSALPPRLVRDGVLRSLLGGSVSRRRLT
ncbi:hypothetical protein GCM10009817_10350 [Terrabacter lapilli]|uniref:Uncharacterized protein n=1 Tax=Terrabacter lapilli TaxID=436231 RepID=A0ABN2RND5_9MICO|nr:hypothetical protein [Terrabacter sp.]